MSRNSARVAALAACLALPSAQVWAQAALTVESRTVSPDEAFSLSVDLTGGASGAAGVNLRLTGQGDGVNQDEGLSVTQGTILAGHSVSVNTLDGNDDFRAVVYNSTATANFTGDGRLFSLQGRVAHDAINGQMVTFGFDAGNTAVADGTGQVLNSTRSNGVLTVSTPFPQTNDFPAADNNGWEFLSVGSSVVPGEDFFEFEDSFPATPGGSLQITNIEYRATGRWRAPDTVAPHYRSNLVAHVFNVASNKANAFLDDSGNAVGANASGRASVDFRLREEDGQFHTVLEHGISPGQASPVSGGGRDYVLFVDRDDNPASPVIRRPIVEQSQFLNQNLVTSDIVLSANSYRNARFDREALLAASAPVDLQGFDLTRVNGDPNVYLSTEPDLDPFGLGGPLEIPWNPFWLNPTPPLASGDVFRKPTHFRDFGGAAVWGFRKEADQVNDADRFAFFTKAALGVTVQANTIYIAEFVMNTDIADTINAPNYRVRANLFGAAPSGQEAFGTFNEVYVKNVNTANSATLPEYPRPGAPVVNRLYFMPQPQSVGGTFNFSVDFNEVAAGPPNTATGSLWLSEIRLRSVSLSTANSVALLEGAPLQ
jgi:hypothetical protein